MSRVKRVGISTKEMDSALIDLVLKPKSKKIARPPNAFMIFAREHRKSFATQNPNQNNKMISRLLGDAWKNVDLPTRKMYFDKAKQLEALHKQKYPNYFYSPRIARMQKLKRSLRRARLKRCDIESDEEKEDDMKPETFKFSGVPQHARIDDRNIAQPESWNANFYQKSPSPGYVPNNPDYFRNSDPPGNETDGIPLMPFHSQIQPQSSCRSSSSSLCSGFDVCSGPCPDFHCRAPSRCGCSNCEKNWQERMLPPPSESCWNTFPRDYRGDYLDSRSPEPDGFANFHNTSYPYCQNPLITSPCCPPSFSRSPYTMPNLRSTAQPYHGVMPWQQPYHWRPPVEDDQYCYQNSDYCRRKSLDIKCCGSSLPHHYTNPDHRNCSHENNWQEEKTLHSELLHSNETAKSSVLPGVRSGYESKAQKSVSPSLTSTLAETYPSETALATSKDPTLGEEKHDEDIINQEIV